MSESNCALAQGESLIRCGNATDYFDGYRRAEEICFGKLKRSPVDLHTIEPRVSIFLARVSVQYLQQESIPRGERIER